MRNKSQEKGRTTHSFELTIPPVHEYRGLITGLSQTYSHTHNSGQISAQ